MINLLEVTNTFFLTDQDFLLLRDMLIVKRVKLRPQNVWMSHPIFFVSFVSTVKVFHGHIIILIQPLHHKRLKPAAHSQHSMESVSPSLVS